MLYLKLFVSDLINRKKPFSIIIKNLKIELYNSKVRLGITENERISSRSKIKKKIMQLIGIEKIQMGILIIIYSQIIFNKSDNNGKKNELNWPRLIKK